MKECSNSIVHRCGDPNFLLRYFVGDWIGIGDAPEWRWLRGREDSPWYPNMRLVGRADGERRASVFSRVAAVLQTL